MTFAGIVWRSIASLAFGFALFAGVQGSVRASDFQFERETFSFVNSTVFDYQEGQIVSRGKPAGERKTRRYTRRCFIMSRAALQFHKFARFDPRGAPLDDRTLAKRVRQVAHKRPWRPALPDSQRIVFPGYPDVRSMSKARARILQENLGLGWPTYLRLGNGRMFYKHGLDYQVKTQAILDEVLARGDMFVGYLSDYPTLHINHSVLVYERKPGRGKNGIIRYRVYDPNHADAPRELTWSPSKRAFSFEKDEEFVGGFTRVYQVYGKPFQ